MKLQLKFFSKYWKNTLQKTVLTELIIVQKQKQSLLLVLLPFLPNTLSMFRKILGFFQI